MPRVIHLDEMFEHLDEIRLELSEMLRQAPNESVADEIERRVWRVLYARQTGEWMSTKSEPPLPF